uniref:Large ribosomal subunit protein uL23c n=1 Tax=Symphyocladiella dendroidea TaxID=2506487 RepID=A0A1Z1M7V6_9FLOR|nr:ribosomal protein L23 [Symphyocladiella dendroidea]ARW61911.1 ribosomal protein L23 [Symphyocladiella dendroidea]
MIHKNKIIEPDIIKYPIITDKTTKNIENNSYCFKVAKKSNKNQIKTIIEEIFNVKVQKINTLNMPNKVKTIGKFKGKITQYKKAIIQLHKEYTIKLFED